MGSMGDPAARAALAPLFEGAPRFLARLVAERPLGTWDRLFERARAIAHDMPEAEQVELLDAHPRLGASPASLSTMSAREQGASPDADLPATSADADLAATLARLNDAYEARFGFRYCVFVAGRPLRALVPDFEASLAADRDAELHRALDAVVDIAHTRHLTTQREARHAAIQGAATRRTGADR
jgi:2-oxo-4-hydroxy-4-carboxy-5-ureidoimidazoline decarboxylase